MGQGSRSKVQEVLASLTEQVIDKLKRVQEGEKLSPFESPWEGDPMPRNFTTNEYYHGVNIFGLWVAAETNNYTSNEWCTPKQLLAYARKNKIDVSIQSILEQMNSELSEDELYKCVLCLHNIFKVIYNDKPIHQEYIDSLTLIKDKLKFMKIKFKIMDILEKR